MVSSKQPVYKPVFYVLRGIWLLIGGQAIKFQEIFVRCCQFYPVAFECLPFPARIFF